MSEELQARLDALEAENVALRTQCKQSPLQPTLTLSDAPAICRIAVKLPPFWPDRVTVWFAQAEAQFHLAGVVTDDTKYSHVLSQIDYKIAGEIEDIVTNPPSEGKYQKLKDTLINRFSASKEQRVRQLLSDEELGDKKPSQILRHLRSLAGNTFSNDNILRQLWLRRLPQHVQGILAVQADLTLDKIADIADRIVEVQPGPANVYSASASPLTAMTEQIEELNKKVAALSSASTSATSGSRHHSTFTSNQPSRSSSSDRSDKRCWYHRRYGNKALKCIPPCNWSSENSDRNQ